MAYKFPTHCPFCQAKLERRGVHWFDPNKDCPERIYMQLRYSLSKSCLDWDGMGESQVRLFVANGAKSLSDVMASPGAFLKASALKKFTAERERVKKAPLWRKLAALGIEGCGRSTSKDLAARYRSLETIVDTVRDTPQEVKAMLGEVAYAAFVAGLKESIEEIIRLDDLGFNFVDDAAAAGPLSGKVFVITGALMSGTRDAVAARIEAAGGMVKSSVSKATTFLICGEAPGANKTAGAAKHGTKVIDESELYTMLGIPMPEADGIAEDILT